MFLCFWLYALLITLLLAIIVITDCEGHMYLCISEKGQIGDWKEGQ